MIQKLNFILQEMIITFVNKRKQEKKDEAYFRMLLDENNKDKLLK